MVESLHARDHVEVVRHRRGHHRDRSIGRTLEGRDSMGAGDRVNQTGYPDTSLFTPSGELGLPPYHKALVGISERLDLQASGAM